MLCMIGWRKWCRQPRWSSWSRPLEEDGEEGKEEDEEEEEERGEEASCSSLRMHLRLFLLLPTYAYERYMIMI